MSRIVWMAALAAIASVTIAEETTRTWEGTWNNHKYGTKGPLKCVASEVRGENETRQFKGTFTGTFQGDPFTYEATFDARPSRRDGQFDLSGKATIRGHKYEWSGLMRGKTLNGKYKSSVGYYGEFVLKEK